MKMKKLPWIQQYFSQRIFSTNGSSKIRSPIRYKDVCFFADNNNNIYVFIIWDGILAFQKGNLPKEPDDITKLELCRRAIVSKPIQQGDYQNTLYGDVIDIGTFCLLYTSPSPRDRG